MGTYVSDPDKTWAQGCVILVVLFLLGYGSWWLFHDEPVVTKSEPKTPATSALVESKTVENLPSDSENQLITMKLKNGMTCAVFVYHRTPGPMSCIPTSSLTK